MTRWRDGLGLSMVTNHQAQSVTEMPHRVCFFRADAVDAAIQLVKLGPRPPAGGEQVAEH
jgi:hypothetical protein